ncbi:MAG: glutamate 5-kinase [Acholeplasmatales bacterium]|nr:glutamate 5-kinase [Acholeplasmatales bacterium]
MQEISKNKRILIKIGSSSLVNEDYSVNEPMLVTILSEIKKLNDLGYIVCVVTSGAIAVGMHELGLKLKPKEMALKQACAAIGQAKLMEAYNKVASIYNLKLGQILLSHDDFQFRNRMIHLSNTLDSMFKNRIIPIINENDAIAVDEIKVGDNDTLAALISPMIEANLVILFSDIDGLFTKNPKVYNDAKLISVVENIDKDIIDCATDSNSLVGTGGMKTKIDAAIITTMAGADMIICNSKEIKDLSKIAKGLKVGTLFKAKKNLISKREHWMIFKANSQGYIVIDDGVKEKLGERKLSILPKGIIEVGDEFLAGSVIDIKDKNNLLIGKGITNYSSSDIALIKQLSSEEAKEKIGFLANKGVIYADDMVILKEGYYGRFVK